MPTIDIIAGARPNFMKIAPIIRAIRDPQISGNRLDYRLIHTGQHYDDQMSATFFKQLHIPKPDVNLEVGSGTHAEQTAAIMLRYEKLLLEKSSDLCLVVGDVTSTMACAIVAQKLCIPVAHVEGGIRSGDWSMPEEINRMATDAISNWFFTTSEHANANLRQLGVADERIYFVGNTMIDTLLANMDQLKPPSFWQEMALQGDDYVVITLHRPANVDQEVVFGRMLNALGKAARGLPLIFPVHPRTAKTLAMMSDVPSNIRMVDAQPYLEFNYLVKNARAVVTDSGGITEEATVMGVPCMTMRDSTERPETIEIGTNELIGTDPSAIAPAFERLFQKRWKQGGIPEKWDGRAGERIVSILRNIL